VARPRFFGVISPFVTPFRRDLSLDLDAVRWLARYQAERGVHGVFPNSTTGEFVHLRESEALELTRAVVEEVGGDVWVIPGITANCTEHAIELGRRFLDMGVDGLVVAPPYFFKPGRDELKKHFSRIAERLDAPIILYNIPSTTGINLSIDLVTELAREHSNIVAAKVTFESFTYLRKLIKEVKSVRSDFAVLTGLDEMLLPTLMMGGDGGIMGLANVAPQIHRAVYDAWSEGDVVRAYAAWRRLLKLVEVYDVAKSFPTAVKAALKALGAPIEPIPRPPLEPEPPQIEERIREILRELGLLSGPR